MDNGPSSDSYFLQLVKKFDSIELESAGIANSL